MPYSGQRDDGVATVGMSLHRTKGLVQSELKSKLKCLIVNFRPRELIEMGSPFSYKVQQSFQTKLLKYVQVHLMTLKAECIVKARRSE